MLLVGLAAESGLADGEVHVEHVLEGEELGEDVVQDEGHSGVGPVASVEREVANGREDRFDIGLGGGDGQGGLSELGELGDDVEGRQRLEENALRVVLGVHAGGPVVQVGLGGSIDAEQGAGGSHTGARGDAQNKTALLIDHVGQNRARDEHGGLNVDANQVTNEAIFNGIKVLGVGVANTNVVDQETDIFVRDQGLQTRVVIVRRLREINGQARRFTLASCTQDTTCNKYHQSRPMKEHGTRPHGGTKFKSALNGISVLQERIMAMLDKWHSRIMLCKTKYHVLKLVLITSSNLDWVRETIKTFHPFLYRSWAKANPMPSVAPVITIVTNPHKYQWGGCQSIRGADGREAEWNGNQISQSKCHVPAQDPGRWYFLSLEPAVSVEKTLRRTQRTAFAITKPPTAKTATRARVEQLQPCK